MSNFKFYGWKNKNRQPQSSKRPTKNVLGYTKDEVIATVEKGEKKFFWEKYLTKN